jgi:Spy/CpxP family protein refolding chaperone
VNDGLEYLGRARIQGLVLLLVVLLAGVLLGAAGDRLLSWREGSPGGGPPRHGPPRHGPPGLPQVLDRMDLSAAQRDAIDSLLRAYRPRSEAILRTVLPELRSQSDSLRAQVRAVLTPAQQREFDRAMARRPRGEFEPPFPPPGHRGPPPGFGPPEGGPPPPPGEDGPPPPPGGSR